MNAARRAAPVVAVAAASVVAILAAGTGMPEPIATHWNGSGRPDGSMPVATFAAVQAALILGVAAWSAWGRRVDAPVRAFLLAAFLLADVSVVVANWHVADWRAARSMPIGLVLAGSLACAGVATLVRLRTARPAPPPAPATTLGEGERVVWTGGARNVVLLVLGSVLAAAGAALLVADSIDAPAPLVLLAAVAMVATAQARVVVSEAGVRVELGPWRWPRIAVATSDIAAARATTHRAASWGYRGSRRVFGTATVAVRRGPALELSLADGTTFTVTVDDAGTAAEVVAAYVGRAAAARGGG